MLASRRAVAIGSNRRNTRLPLPNITRGLRQKTPRGLLVMAAKSMDFIDLAQQCAPTVAPQTLAAIQGLFEEGMACQYAGAQTSSDMVSRIIGQARELGAALEKELRT